MNRRLREKLDWQSRQPVFIRRHGDGCRAHIEIAGGCVPGCEADAQFRDRIKAEMAAPPATWEDNYELIHRRLLQGVVAAAIAFLLTLWWTR